MSERGSAEKLRRWTAAAFLTALVALTTGVGAPGDLFANPVSIVRSIAVKSARLSELTEEANRTLARLDRSLEPLAELDGRMDELVGLTGTSVERTEEIGRRLELLDGTLARQERELAAVTRELARLDLLLASVSSQTGSSLLATNGMASDFARVESSLAGLASSLDRLLAAIGDSAPKVGYFSTNRLRAPHPGGDPAPYNALNIAAGTRVMSVMIPTIATLQNGGLLISRKDSATASQDFILRLLNEQVPDGANVKSTIRRFDGRYGLPGNPYFVSRRVGGF